MLEVLSFCPVIVSNQRPKFSVPCCLLVHEVWRRRPKERTLLRHLTACFSVFSRSPLILACVFKKLKNIPAMERRLRDSSAWKQRKTKEMNVTAGIWRTSPFILFLVFYTSSSRRVFHFLFLWRGGWMSNWQEPSTAKLRSSPFFYTLPNGNRKRKERCSRSWVSFCSKPSDVPHLSSYFLYFTLPRWWISFLSLDVQRGTVCSIMKGLLQRLMFTSRF